MALNDVAWVVFWVLFFRRVGTIHGWDRSRVLLLEAALTTGGGVVFYGTLDGWFKAVDARDGKLLWKFKVGAGVVGNPISYRGPDGKQYVAVYSGPGGDWFLLAGDIRSDDPADVRPAADFMRDLARHTSLGGMVWVFALGS
jgi:outer membrane protein assembly factor BamB